MKPNITIIGAGLAGCEAAWQIVSRGFPVALMDAKPLVFSPAHSSPNFCELVCSNSLKGEGLATSQGLLKKELEMLDSFVLKCAVETKVKAGGALAVDREQFSALVTKRIKEHPLITIKEELVTDIFVGDTSATLSAGSAHGVPKKNNNNIVGAAFARPLLVADKTTGSRLLPLQVDTTHQPPTTDHQTPTTNHQPPITIIATGPLTIGKLNDCLKTEFNNNLHFFDAAAPIVSFDSIDMEKAFVQDRYDKGDGNGDYINCPMTKEEYELFQKELTTAECVIKKEFETKDLFSGCMPIEEMAKRGVDTMRHGPLKPVGLTCPKTEKRPYAVVQLRRENERGTMFNLVGFQTNLKFGEQKRVFSLIPALQNAEFLRFGVMHRNSFINAPKTINRFFQTLKHHNIFIAGQLSGVEGYVESIMSGLVAGINAVKLIKSKPLFCPPKGTMSGELCYYLEQQNENFQPMNANFGLLPNPETTAKKIPKAEKKLLQSEKALKIMNASLDSSLCSE
ncbi:MAG: methylenetetrahydrofolate--tRNA-(uracil(54)-C(5))-methyltransferase (FADH(2)-oxidizing) TrmFO [Firmicutes bacterium]|nr:methylenetetrahydrofolate--tRNA-(uracil(54)-C(5))-methyltransferase (FADH(2)-oxidizing) TrmFO [Bacillota bacterium]